MIRSLASALTGAAVAMLLAGCGDGGPIEENVVRPGITALEQASALACGSDADVLGKAIEAYHLLENEPPPDEGALVTAGFLREESTRYDVVDGQIVPVAVDCGGSGAAAVAPATMPSGSPPMTAPSTDLGEIVTSTEPLTAEQMLAEFTPEEVAEVGGQECARELAAIFVAAEDYVAEQGRDPETIDDLAGYLDQPIELWVVRDDSLAAAPGSGCVDIEDSTDDPAAGCRSEATTLAVAREAYLASTPDAAEPTEDDLVAAGLLSVPSDALDLVAGDVVAIPGGPCEGVALG